MSSARDRPDGLQGFHPATRRWFRRAFGAPTPVQREAWAAIRAGGDVLAVAPTGSGKTLAAFLASIDGLVHENEGAGVAVAPTPAPDASARPSRTAVREARERARRTRTRVVYISPLKALAVDVDRNLRAPLAGIVAEARAAGRVVREPTIAVRSGDTTARERRAQSSHPPDVLITTPESFYLLLTSAARDTLRGVRTVIVDEIHAVAATKRGAHLAVSLERLDLLVPHPAQRIGLSATVRPLAEVARFLGGAHPVRIVAPSERPHLEVHVVVPVDDMRDPAATPLPEGLTDPDAPAVPSGTAVPPDAGGPPDELRADPRHGSMWPHIDADIFQRVLSHRSTIVFTNARFLAERLTAHLNQLWEGWRRRAGTLDAGPGGRARRESASSSSIPRPMPAQVGASFEMVDGAAPAFARAHHGSVSKEQRARIEADLKSGALRCVVATSSLELGIDMGEVDQVIQVAPPPSVASGLQRVGRAGHHVGDTSRGYLYPRTRIDLLDCAVAAERMRAGAIERLRVVANPLDVLAQQTVAAASVDELRVDAWYATVRRAAPFAALPRSAFDATLGMLAGAYPSGEFAVLRPRIVWDRDAGTLTARPGGQRLAVTSGGTIPDRGQYAVVLAANPQEAGRGGRRVGELDEEMVYESRIGDVFTLGATSWRIQEITRDRVLVTPAPGRPARLPFWHGEGEGRPAELGEATGAFVRRVQARPAGAGVPAECGLDARGAANLRALLADQRAAAGVVATDRTLCVECVRDEVGDWRIVLESPWGKRVHAPWALCVAARLRERFRADAGVVASDDGIVARLPGTEQPPEAQELFAVDPGAVEPLVTRELASSALFASRFRECATRALLFSPQRPGRRAPLWQQRRRAEQLLGAARAYPDFPILLEATRECLRDVYDVPALVRLMERVERGDVRLVDVATDRPSPFAQNLLFGYVGEFMYEGDQPLAERRASALALDPGMLRELLGTTSLRDLLDPDVVEQVEAEAQRLAPARRVRGIEGVADLLRELGPLSAAEVAERCADPGAASGWLAELRAARRACPVRMAGEARWCAVEDAAALRDALGVEVAPEVPRALLGQVAHPLADLAARYARTHGPITAARLADRLGIGVAPVEDALSELEAAGRVRRGEFRPGGRGEEWVDEDVLSRLRGRSQQKARAAVRPVGQVDYARFLLDWQGVGSGRRGEDALLDAVELLAGVAAPLDAWERWVLPARVADYQPAELDRLIVTGQVVWRGEGGDAEAGVVSLWPAGEARARGGFRPDRAEAALLAVLGRGGGFFFGELAQAALAGLGGSGGDAEPLDAEDLRRALWRLVWDGQVTGDTLAPLRAGSGRGPARRRAPRVRPGRRVRLRPSPWQTAERAGRWSALPAPRGGAPGARSAVDSAERLLDRYGVVARGAVGEEDLPGGFAALYPVLRQMEDAGRCRRGLFVRGLGAAQFAQAATVDRLRALAESGAAGADDVGAPAAQTLAAADPANPYGAALPWPEAPSGGRPARRCGALVVLVDGRPAVYLQRGGHSALTWSADARVLAAAAASLARAARAAAVPLLSVDRVDDRPAARTPLGRALVAAGFYSTPSSVRLRP